MNLNRSWLKVGLVLGLAWGLSLVSSSQPQPRRLNLACEETLVFPEKGELPPEAQGIPCSWQRQGENWSVTGLVPGRLSFRWGEQWWELVVQERALKLPAQADLKVFGGYSTAAALLHWARDFLHPRAELKLNGNNLLARGSDLIPFEGLPKVQLEEVAIPAQPAEQLLLSNWPERIEQDQILLEQALTSGSSWRVMLHHRNLPEQPGRWLEIELLGESLPSRWAISSLLAGPSADEIFAGHLATRRYLGESNSGYLVQLASPSRHLLERWWMKPGQTVSGMLLLRRLEASGGVSGARLRISARQGDNLEPLVQHPLDPKARTARGAFPAEIRKQISYSAGPNYHFEAIGAQPYLKEVETGLASPGNFGAVYRYQLELSNPLEQDQEISLQLSARGGPARAFLWLGGTSSDLVETPLLKAEPYLVKRWYLPAGQRLGVKLETMPQAGSNFPLDVTLSSRAWRGSPGSEAPGQAPDWRIP